MHPDVIRDIPGLCPECGMNLVPVKVARKQVTAEHGRHAAHRQPDGFDKHAGHSTDMFLRKFWVNFILTIPVVLYADVVKKIFKWYFDNWQRRKAKAGIKARIIYSAKLKGKRPMAVQKLTKVKFSPERFEFPSTVIAFGNKVAIITWEPNPTGFLLESKETAKTFLNYFELLWKAARK